MQSQDFQQNWTNLALCAIVVLAFVAWGLHSWLKKRPTPDELEQRRRALLNSIGKMGDGTITEIQEWLIYYSYEVRGVEYLASQDISSMASKLPFDPWSALGSASVKYDPRNPANSIVICEQWSGLRNAPAKLEL
jgi:hypothetical protein